MKNLQNFTLVSRTSEVLPSFRGPLIQYRILQSIDHEKGFARRWTVFSQGKRSTMVRYLFAKLLWDELNTLESRVFWCLPEITTDLTIYLSLKALAFGLSRKLLRERLESGQIFGLKFISRQSYISVKGRCHFFLFEEQVTLRRTTKFSGYTKHYKDKGSLGAEREEYFSELLEPISNVSEELLFEFLTVGKIPLFGGSVPYPEDDPIRSKR